jgi:cysteine desulfurase
MAIYLDYAASVPISAEVLATFTEALQTVGNPSSTHSLGQGSRMMLEDAREQIALAVGCDRSEVIFTAGGTESDNLAIKGLFWKRRGENPARNVIVSTYMEHHAVIDPIEWLEAHEGAEVAWIGVSDEGVIDLAALESFLAARGSEVALITMMWANNEVGVINDIKAVTALAAKHGIPVHSDAIAAFGHVPIDFKSSGLSALSISAHKVAGPVGVGALILSRAETLTPLVHGGGQERSMRSGTMNSAGAKAFAHAASLAVANMPKHNSHTLALVERLRDGIESTIAGARFSRGSAESMTHNAHFTFEGLKSDGLLFLLDQADIAVSAGSACQAGVDRPSHVLLAMGRSEEEANSCLRITVGLQTTEAEIERFLQVLPTAVATARSANPT